jgi:8-oxo-dGTP pyrophosphatase MutT (NUDIX family)
MTYMIMQQLLASDSSLVQHIIRVLNVQALQNNIISDQSVDPEAAAGVLLLLAPGGNNKNNNTGPCLILNKRSLKVRQPGDLCFPGGSVTPRLDSHLAKLFSLPVTSLGRWEYWPQWKYAHPQTARFLALFWATGLRESFEEMRLNPFGVKFLGPLPPQPLVMFRRVIYPMVAWVRRQKRFFPNWEVDKIVYIPLRDLLDTAKYRRYRLCIQTGENEQSSNSGQDYPCFYFQTDSDTEILWGATYRIATLFVEYIFGFKPPSLETLPVVEGSLDPAYLTGHK